MRALLFVSDRIGTSWVLGYCALISVVTIQSNRSDKWKAQAGAWRTPESTLHTLELLGGWPAAFITQRVIRHKTAKSDYQFTFWAIVVLHQYLSIDLTQAWRWSRWIYALARPLLDRG